MVFQSKPDDWEVSRRSSVFAISDNPAAAGTGARNQLFGIGASDSALSTLTIPAAAKAMIVNARPILRRPRRVVGFIWTSAAQAGGEPSEWMLARMHPLWTQASPGRASGYPFA